MKRYCLGFNFVKNRKSVLLIGKLTPAWQRGYWNGLGGTIEAHEFATEAMVREFHEEAGVQTFPREWDYVGRSHFVDTNNPVGKQCIIYVFRRDIDIAHYTPQCDEGNLWIHDVDLLPKMLPLQQAMLLMCLDRSTVNMNFVMKDK